MLCSKSKQGSISSVFFCFLGFYAVATFSGWILLHYHNVLSVSPLQFSCFTERALERAIPVEDINLFQNPYRYSSETTENSPFFLWKCLLVAVSPTAAKLKTCPSCLSLSRRSGMLGDSRKDLAPGSPRSRGPLAQASHCAQSGLCQSLENQPRFPLSMESLVQGQVQSQDFQDHMLGPAILFWTWREKGGKQGRTTAFVWGDDSFVFFFQAAVSLEHRFNNGFRKPHVLGRCICWDSVPTEKNPLAQKACAKHFRGGSGWIPNSDQTRPGINLSLANSSFTFLYGAFIFSTPSCEGLKNPGFHSARLRKECFSPE